MKNMPQICSGRICASTEDTVINGEKIRFYKFPTDENLINEWKRLLSPDDADDLSDKVLCELHFEKSCFDKDKQLKPDSVPTYSSFGKTLVTGPKFSSAYDEPAAKKAKDDNPPENNETPADDKVAQKKVKPYRLTVQIDKFVMKPNKKSKNQNEIKLRFIAPSISSELREVLEQSLKLRNGKRLPAYNQCLVCKKVFVIPSDLYDHVKEHFTCDICKGEFTSRKSHNKHYKIHESDDLESPYKCHVCNLLFLTKESLCEHSHIKDPQIDVKPETFECSQCQAVFKSFVAFRKHVMIHKKESSFDTAKSSRAKVAPSQDKPAIELNCNICNVKLPSMIAAQNHSKLHMSDKRVNSSMS